jgi:hypothetical protein
VRAVENAIEVLPVSDQELRISLARRIYGDLLFVHYAAAADPPIHIVVAGGKVTLEGTVRHEVERRLAESIARSDSRTFGVTNHLVVEGAER